MTTNLEDLIMYSVVGVMLILQLYAVWDAYRKNFRSEWMRTAFLAVIMFMPVIGVALYAVLSHKFIRY